MLIPLASPSPRGLQHSASRVWSQSLGAGLPGALRPFHRQLAVSLTLSGLKLRHPLPRILDPDHPVAPPVSIPSVSIPSTLAYFLLFKIFYIMKI